MKGKIFEFQSSGGLPGQLATPFDVASRNRDSR